MIDWLNSHISWCQKPSPWSQGRKHHSEGKNVRRTLHTKRKRKWYKKYSEEATSPKIETRVATGAPAFEGRLNEGLRLQRKHRDKKRSKTKQNKRNTREKNVMASANRTSGGYQFAPLVASQQGRANQHEPAYFGLSSSWSFPSRSGIPLRAVVQPWFILQRFILPWNVPPLVLPFCVTPPRLGLQSSMYVVIIAVVFTLKTVPISAQ